MKNNSKLKKSIVAPLQLPGIHKIPVITAGEGNSDFSINKSIFPYSVRLLKNYIGNPIKKAVNKLPHFYDLTLTFLSYTLIIWCIMELFIYFIFLITSTIKSI